MASHIQPRRRAAATKSSHGQSSPRPTLPQIDPALCSAEPDHTNGTAAGGSDMRLRKGSTFHTPTNAASPATDPVVDFARLPTRAPTSPEALEALTQSYDKRVADIISSFDKGFSGIGGDSSNSEVNDPLPVPGLFLANASLKADERMDGPSSSKDTKATGSAGTNSSHDHTSDSGIGSSVCESNCGSPTIKAEDEEQHSKDAILESLKLRASVFSPLARALGPSREKHFLSEVATQKIRTHIVEPLLREEKLKDFHPLVGDLPVRIGERKITCLRDLEKTLIFLAPRKSKSAALYLRFCETSIQCIHTTVSHLNDHDQRRPTDRPYTNNYFIDLVGQVRQYARIMAASRQKQAEGKTLDKMDYKPGEKLVLKGGLSETGKPAELVREKDGVTIPIEVGRKDFAAEDVDFADDDASRSMARKRKADMGKIEWRACRECGKEFKRPCDLTKHEKTHSRPWKCPNTDCKYFDLGWPTEKERDRHINDKHSNAPALYKCLFSPCTYTSKRESNCKQHMEKAHGWEYVRSKKKQAGALVPTTVGGLSPAPTPASSSTYPQMSTPATSIAESPALTTNSMNSPFTNSLFAPSPANENMDGLDFSGFGYMPMSPESNARAPSDGGDTNMSYDSGIPSSAFTSEFDFNDLGDQNPWPAVEDVFSNIYNLPDSHVAPQQTQQQLPTPSWSDDLQLSAKEQNMAPLDFGGFQAGARDGFMLSQPELSMRLTPAEDRQLGLSPAGDSNNMENDFSLFGDQSTGNNQNVGNSQFSNVGGQFPTGNSQDFNYDTFGNM